jgi:hypothetical protein
MYRLWAGDIERACNGDTHVGSGGDYLFRGGDSGRGARLQGGEESGQVGTRAIPRLEVDAGHLQIPAEGDEPWSVDGGEDLVSRDLS